MKIIKRELECLAKNLQIEKMNQQLDSFEIIAGNNESEQAHSNFLFWLFNPNELHETNFLSLFLKKIIENESNNTLDLAIDKLNYQEVNLIREWSTNISRIDLILEFTEDKLIVAIENKITSKQKQNQLKKYRIGIQKNYPNYQMLFIFLSFIDEQPNDSKWVSVNYNTIEEVIKTSINSDKLSHKIKIFLTNYLSILDKIKKQKEIEISNNRALNFLFSYLSGINFQIDSDEIEESSELINLCQNIYSHYSQQLKMKFQKRLTICSEKKEYRERIVDRILQILKEKQQNNEFKQRFFYEKKRSYKIKIYSSNLNNKIFPVKGQVKNELLYFELWVNVDYNNKIMMRLYVGKSKNDTAMNQIRKKILQVTSKNNDLFTNVDIKKKGVHCIYDLMLTNQISHGFLSNEGKQDFLLKLDQFFREKLLEIEKRFNRLY